MRLAWSNYIGCNELKHHLGISTPNRKELCETRVKRKRFSFHVNKKLKLMTPKRTQMTPWSPIVHTLHRYERFKREIIPALRVPPSYDIPRITSQSENTIFFTFSRMEATKVDVVDNKGAGDRLMTIVSRLTS